MKKNVLVYEPQTGNVPYLAFVLNLGQVGCTHARSAAEALNWVEAARLKIISFDLVLISSLSHEAPEMQMLNSLKGLQIPIVFLQRGTDMPEQLAQIVIATCSTDNLTECLQQYLSAKVPCHAKGETYDRRSNNP